LLKSIFYTEVFGEKELRTEVEDEFSLGINFSFFDPLQGGVLTLKTPPFNYSHFMGNM